MTSPQHSLIQDRFALNRRIASGYGYLVVGVIAIALAVAQLYVLEGVLDIASWCMLLLLGTGIAVVGGSRIRSAKTMQRAFEEQHGVNAGKQEPVTL